MARVILERSSLGETGAVSHSAFGFVGYCPSLTMGGTIQNDPLAMGLCLHDCIYFMVNTTLTMLKY